MIGFALPDELTEPRVDDDDDDLVHFVCECNQDLALCGESLAGMKWIYDSADEEQCIVCADMLNRPCEKCGESLE